MILHQLLPHHHAIVHHAENIHRFGPTLSLESGYKRDCWGQRVVTTNVSSEGDLSPWFSGMSLGDVMRVTVLQEMDKLNMNKSKPMDLSCKPWNLKKNDTNPNISCF